MKWILTLSIFLSFSFSLFSQWLPVGQGFTSNNSIAYVEDLEVYKGELYATGNFNQVDGQAATNVAKWDGSTWVPLPIDVYDWPIKMKTYQGKLIILGRSGPSSPFSGNHISYWDGNNWMELDTSRITGWLPGKSLLDIDTFQNDLYVGGMVSQINGRGAYNFLKWDGIKWIPETQDTLQGYYGPVSNISHYEGSLSVTGKANLIGGIPAKGHGLFDGQAWSVPMFSPPQTTYIEHSHQFKDKWLMNFGWVYEDAIFSFFDYASFLFPEQIEHQNILYSGIGNKMIILDSVNQIQTFGDTLTAGEFYSACIFNGELYVGGAFKEINGDTLNCIAKWAGPLPSGVISDLETFNQEPRISAFPNPVNDFLNLNLVGYENQFITLELSLFSLQGQELKNQFIQKKTEKIDLRDLKPGIYIVQIKGDVDTPPFKIIKE